MIDISFKEKLRKQKLTMSICKNCEKKRVTPNSGSRENNDSKTQNLAKGVGLENFSPIPNDAFLSSSFMTWSYFFHSKK